MKTIFIKEAHSAAVFSKLAITAVALCVLAGCVMPKEIEEKKDVNVEVVG